MKCIPKIKVHQNIVHAELKGGIWGIEGIQSDIVQILYVLVFCILELELLLDILESFHEFITRTWMWYYLIMLLGFLTEGFSQTCRTCEDSDLKQKALSPLACHTR